MRLADRYRALLVAEQRAKGRTWQQVADEFGYHDRATARRAALRAVRSLERDLPRLTASVYGGGR